MKKFFALLLAGLMVFALVACTPTDKPDNPDNPDVTTNPDVTAEPEGPTMVPAAGGQIIYGASTEISGDWGRAMWTNNATDNMIRNLIDDYGTVTTDRDGNYIVNPTVTESIDDVLNEDGSKTFTIKVKSGLVYNNGEPITAKDFIAQTLLCCSPVAKELEITSVAYTQVAGGTEFFKGEADVVTGLRLINENTFSITILSDFVPYYYELGYCAFTPMNLNFWFGEGIDIEDNGEGTKFTGDFTFANIGEKVKNARFQSAGRVSAGPYNLIEFDQAALTATLEINDKYAGNFEGQKPYIEKIVIVRAQDDTAIDSLKTGGFDVYDTITEGELITAALDLVEQGGFDYVQFERAGYGKIVFICDFGPTQFVQVRQAIAHLLDRVEFANTFCQGYGTIVHGPYALAFSMYKDCEEQLNDQLDQYEYSYDKAVALLDECGFNLDENGAPYAGTGLRYRKCTAEEAGTYAFNKTLDDGTILMPLIINWACTEDNPVSELIAVMLAQNPDTAKAGMEIKRTEMTFTELLNYMYRDATKGKQYGVPTYCMLNLATGWNAAVYDMSYEWTQNPDYIAQGYNYIRLFDDELDQLSMDMVYGVDSDDYDKYLDLWLKYIERWNKLLPELPLYSNIYVTVFNEKLKGYEQAPYWSFEQAILYCWINEVEA